MSNIIDDKSAHCIPFLLQRLKLHREESARQGLQPTPPFFLGLNGVQGAGKTTLVSTLAATLSAAPYHLPTVVFSIDDLYLSHADQVALAQMHPENPLVQHRGVPGTHDVALGQQVFAALIRREANVAIPSYDKSAFQGAGDRRPEDQWNRCNVNTSERGGPEERPVELVIFEGWCVGFRALEDDEVRRRWEEARDAAGEGRVEEGGYRGQLGRLNLENVMFVNERLQEYDGLTDRLDALIQIDAQETHFVYDWRQEQEAKLRADRGTGMTVEQVNTFVNGYYPCYELYTDRLREGIFRDGPSRQLRLVIGKDRKVQEVHRI